MDTPLCSPHLTYDRSTGLEFQMQIIHHKQNTKNVGDLEALASMVGAGVVAITALRSRSSKTLLLLTAGELFRRGFTSHSYAYEALGISTAEPPSSSRATLPYPLGIRAEAAVTVNRPRQEVYAFFRQLDQLPRFMKHLEAVVVTDERHSRWTARGPAGKKMVWDAEIYNESPNELIAWRSLEGANVDHAGSVRFKDAAGDRGTEIHVLLQYNPPAGIVGAYFAKLFNEEPSQQIQEDLIRLKQYLEAGELANTEGQPQGPSKSVLRSRERERQQMRPPQRLSDRALVNGGVR